jgi:hypothetical protein
MVIREDISETRSPFRKIESCSPYLIQSE